jgi:hypothetical protein
MKVLMHAEVKGGGAIIIKVRSTLRSKDTLDGVREHRHQGSETSKGSTSGREETGTSLTDTMT